MGVRESASTVALRAARRLHRAGYLRRWIVLGVLIGTVAGLGGVLFVHAIRIFEWLLLEVVGGYRAPGALGEGGGVGTGFSRPWAIPLVAALGGLLAGAIVDRFAPEAEGHGTDAAIQAMHHHPTGIRARVAVVKLLSSALTIGSGGSAGREGPTAQISASFGSVLARKLDLTPSDARLAVTAGIGAGIGAVFRAPLGGAVLGAEILYRDDIEAEALFPSFIASITGFAIFGAFEGFTPIFGYLAPGHFTEPLQLVLYAIIGLLAGAFGIVYAKTFYGTARAFARVRLPTWVKPAIGGLAVGLLGLVIPGALGTGYGWVQRAMGASIATIPLWMILALPLAKIVATSLSIGSGGSGGIFGPGIVIGGFVGAGLWQLLEGTPGVPDTPAPFVIVGMIACFGSIAHAPLAMILMVAGMTGNLELVAPAMIAIGVATLVVGDRSIYENQLKDRHEAPAHRFRFGMPLLASVHVSEAVAPATLVVDAADDAGAVRRRITEAEQEHAQVIDDTGRFRGVVSASALADADPDRPVGELADRTVPTLPLDATLESAIEVLAEHQIRSIPVLADDQRLAGELTASDLLRSYRLALNASLKTLASVPKGTTLLETTVREGVPATAARVGTTTWPAGTVFIAIQRGEQMLLPHDDTELLAGDTVSLIAPAGQEGELRRLLEGTASETPPR